MYICSCIECSPLSIAAICMHDELSKEFIISNTKVAHIFTFTVLEIKSACHTPKN